MSRAIVVMGATVRADGEPSQSLQRRTACAAALWHGRGGIVIATGGVGRHPPSEAEVMRRELCDAGVPEDKIILEPHATSTLQNARFSIGILRERNLNDVIVVTENYHRLRTWLTFARLGQRVHTVSASRSLPRPRLAVQVRHWARETVAVPVYAVKLVFFGG